MYSIRETFEFQREINISYTFIHSLCCFFFSSSPWGVLIFPTNLPFYLAAKNPYDLRSQIRFWILPKNAPCVGVIFTWRNDLMTLWYVMAPHAWPPSSIWHIELQSVKAVPKCIDWTIKTKRALLKLQEQE